MSKTIIHVEHYDDPYARCKVIAKYYDNGTYSTWCDGELTVLDALWKIEQDKFWFKHPHMQWETLREDSPFYPQSQNTVDAIMAMQFLEKVISDD